MHMCLLDLQKAFDSMEFPVLLDRLTGMKEERAVSKSMVQFQKHSPLRKVSAKGQYCPNPHHGSPSEVAGVLRLGAVCERLIRRCLPSCR